MFPLGKKTLSFFFDIDFVGTGGLLGTIPLAISTACFEINLRLFPFGVKEFICRCVGVVSQIIFRFDCSD